MHRRELKIKKKTFDERESLEWRQVTETPISFWSAIFVNGPFVKAEIIGS